MNDPSLITLDSIVRGALADEGRDTLHKYIQYLKWGIEFVEEFHLTKGVSPKTVKLNVDTKKSVKLPVDCVKVTKVGIMRGDRLVPYVVDNTIGFRQTNPPAANSKYIDVVGGDRELFVYSFLNYYTSTGTISSLEGYGSKHNGAGYFRIDETTRTIQLESDVTASAIYVEFISNGFNPCTKTLVPGYARLEITNGIHWYTKRFKLGDSSSETQWAKKEYQQAVQERVNLQSDFTYEGLVDAMIRSVSSTIKY